MKEIKLTQGQFAVVDDECFEWLNKYKWYLYKGRTGIFYAHTGIYDSLTKKNKQCSMHRMIMNAKTGQIIDHVNRNGLDNRMINLRFASKSENAINSKKRSNAKSKYKGVDFRPSRNKFRARINVNGKAKNLGHYDTDLEAAMAYNAAVKLYFGEFANFNEL